MDGMGIRDEYLNLFTSEKMFHSLQVGLDLGADYQLRGMSWNL